MIRLWGRRNSVNVQKVVITLDELGLPYERIDAGQEFGRNRTPEFLAMNPNGMVPVIEIDDFILWESNAIVRYLAARYGIGRLWAESLEGRADADRWMDWQATILWPALRPAYFQIYRTPEAERNARLLDESIAKTDALMQILDARLGDRDYLTGESFSIADIVLGVVVYRWLNMPIARSDYPALTAWYARMCRRPAFRAISDLPLS
jgi:glutathione S-transferase